MVELKTILSARRAYLFAQDDIRLTTLSIRGVIDAIKTGFGFELAEIGTPNTSFGPTALTNPPGLAFALGVTPYPEEGSVIRSMSIDARRIIFDVVAPTTVIPGSLDRLRQIVGGFRSSENGALIGEPISFRDYSELVVRSDSIFDAVLRSEALAVVSNALAPHEENMTLVPAVKFQIQPPSVEFPGTSETDVDWMRLEVRAGTAPSEHVFFSGAPLSTDDHLALLARLAGNS